MFTLDAELGGERYNFKEQKTKTEIKEELEDSIINGRTNESTDMQDIVNGCTSCEDARNVIQDFEQIIQNKKNDIVWLAYYQGQIFQKFREKERFINDMVSKVKVSKSTIGFKIALRKLIDNYPKIKKSSLSLHYFKRHLKLIKGVCKENASKLNKFL